MNSNVLRCCSNYLCTNFDSTIEKRSHDNPGYTSYKIMLNLILIVTLLSVFQRVMKTSSGLLLYVSISAINVYLKLE